MKKTKSKDQKSKKSKDKPKKDQQNKSQKSGKSGSKSKGKDKSGQNSKDKKQSKSPTKKQSKSKKPVDQSQVSSISLTPVAPANCIHHSLPFIGFCQTCQELVCNQCTVFGPHNNHLHRILKMTDAYRLRKFYLVQAIRSNLVDKRDKIIAQLHRLQYRVQQIRFVKNIIERDIRSQYSGILQRLKNHQGIKFASLTHQVSLVQRQIDTINDIGNKFFELTNMECQKIEQERRMNKFLMKSKEMYQNIEYITNRADKVAPDLALNQIPREVQTNRDLVKKALAGRQINNFKNQILWKLVTDMKAQQNSIKRQVQEKSNTVVRQLSQEVQVLSHRLNNCKLICAFCGTIMTAQTVNQQCTHNHNTQLTPQSFAHLAKPPTQKQIGNKRHYFIKSQ